LLESIGRPSPNVEVTLVNREGREVALGEVGEIVVRGDTVMKRYFNDPEKTAAVLKDGALHTGDLGRREKDGFISFIGREDEVINFGGFKISPYEIEKSLLKFPNVKDAAAIGIHSQETGLTTSIKAFVVLADDALAFDSNALRKHCLSELEAYKIPSAIEVVPNLPKTQSGKTKRLELRNLQ
jgi:long-chain acyl-CoA synthetase